MAAFPHPTYARYVLRPAYDGAAAHLFEPMLAANRAHVVMLTEQAIVDGATARALLAALDTVAAEGIAALAYQPGVEDLFFRVEGRLIELAGAEHGGQLQLARSRNDLGHALTRLALRPALLAAYGALLALRRSVEGLARAHVATVMPGYTHTQPAQPATFGHYLAGVLSFLERDTARLRRAYATTNRSPLGAAAFTGTGFPIDRRRSAELLGFDDVMASSQDSIGASDHLTDIAAALTSVAVNLGRMTKDMLFWATRESGALVIDDSFIQISSIMPQKRNPVVLEHLRARLSRLLGQAQTIVIQCHNIPYGDTQDIEDEIEPTLFGGLATAVDCLDLYTAVFDTLQVNVDHLRAQAAAGFTTVTELADTLVRVAGLPFRTAHHIVSTLVRRALADGLAPGELTAAHLDAAAAAVDAPLPGLTTEQVRRALDPVAFVAARETLGGAAPAATTAVLDDLAAGLAADERWLAAERAQLVAADEALRAAVDAYLTA